ncbi:MAG: alpha-N-acetylglucosaminidase [Bacteroides sp.]|nr:alpha-N-acetylglucosaminidase [Bacteroides sp.]
MKINKRTFAALTAMALWAGAFAAVNNPKSVSDLLNRIGGAGTADKFETVVDETLATGGKETFVITSSAGKPCIKGSTLSALTTGIGWYLNHHANINLTWNQPRTNMATATLPVPASAETHTTSAEYRYYLNYCTFSYSMSTWTWDRWQEEIDWMALRGINMPLQIIGLEEVWRKFLMEDYGYSQAEVDAYVAGPCYMAWFGMNNLQGWGGPNPTWWYERQAQLGKQIGDRMRELGIEPVLPGFCQLPSTFSNKTGILSVGQGNWCGFQRPFLANPADAKFDEVADKFYKRVTEVMGESKYYSMDPFHEGGSVQLDAPTLYQRLYQAMERNHPGSQWVIQSWQWNGKQTQSVNNVPEGKLIVLDLFSDGNPNWGSYGKQPVVYSTIFNFGGRTGYFGRAQAVIDGYWNAKTSKSTVTGIGAAPEAIEQTPVVYDLLFELPWCDSKPDAQQWFKDYSTRRYGVENENTATAWELLRTSALNRQGAGQGPHEALMCARPNLTSNKVSTWGFNELYYDPNMVTEAAYQLLEAGENGTLDAENYSFDLTDISRQALTDYVRKLIPAIQQANSAGDTELFNKRKEGLLQLILDIDELLNTNTEFMLGHWTERARNMADEVSGTTLADRDWLELNNARQLITTWGANNQAEGGGLRDYSYRQWGGLMKDYYYARWKTWFDNGMKAPSSGWFQWEWNWAHNNPGIYPTEPIGDSREVASRVLPKYLSPFKSTMEGMSTYYVPHFISTDVSGKLYDKAAREATYHPDFNVGDVKITEIAIDFNKNGLYEDDEISDLSGWGEFAIPADAPVGERRCRITLEDATVFTFTLSIIEEITVPRTVTVKTSDAAKGSVSIEGTDALSVTNTDIVTILATPTQKYDFDHWEDAAGNDVGNDNPMKYYSKDAAEFTAYFRDNIWGVPGFYAGGKEYPVDDMKKEGQYLISLGVTQGNESTTFFESTEIPDEHFYYVSNRIKAAPGGAFHFNYQGQGDLRYNFLSAYCDLDANGKFEPEKGELLGTKGTYHTQDASVGQGGFDVLLPYDTPTGITHIRMRFDGAWLDQEVSGAWDSANGAFKPEVATNRVIYEVLLEVNDGVEYACNVTVNVNNDAFGTVRSENSTNVYNPGERVILTAFPNLGYQLDHWEDSRGRTLPSAWMNGNMIEFTAFDNADITAVLVPIPVEVDLWKFNLEVDDEGDEYISELVEAGEPDLDLSANHSGFSDDIYYIDPKVFAGNTVLRSITLPDQPLYKKGELLNKTDVILGNIDPETGVKADQVVTFLKDENGNNYTMTNTPFNYSEPFTMKITGYNNGESFNQYGSVLFAKGDDGLADSYINGWSQFYLRADGTLDVKWTSAAATHFPVNIYGKFEIVVEYLGDNNTRITVANSAGEKHSVLFENHTAMKNINRFATALPDGMWIQVRFSKPDEEVIPGELLMGCRNLMDIHLSKDCTYAVEKNGVIYDKSGKNCIAYPEGRILGGAFSLKTANGTSEFTAAPVKDGDSYSNLTVKTTTQTSNWNTLWTIDEDGSLIHYNSGLGVNNAGTELSADDAKLTYALSYDEGDPSISFINENGKYVNGSGVTDDSFSFDFYPVTELTVPGDATKPRTVTFPVNVIVPNDAEVFSLDKVGSKGGYVSHIMPGHIIPAGTGVLIEGPVAPFEITSLPSAESPDLLDGTNVDLVLHQPYFVLEGENFVLKQSGTVPANTGYVIQRFVSEASFPYRATGYEPVEIDGWKFDWRESYNENVICLTAAIEAGNPSLDLSDPIEETGDKVVDIDPAMFQNNTKLYEVTLPAQRLAHHYYDSSVEGQGTPGAGTQNQYTHLQLPQPLTGEKGWKLTMDCYTDGSTFNQWGSSLFASGNDPVANNFTKGIQLYLSKAGQLTVKVGNYGTGNGQTHLNSVSINGDFTIVMEYSKDAGNNFSTTISVVCNGQRASHNYAGKFNPISEFSAAIPTGVNINKIHFEGEDFSFPYNEGELFTGCTNLQDIHLAEGADYAVENDGVLYDAEGNCIAYPEGRLYTRPFVMTCADNVKIGANPIEEDGYLSETDVLADANHTDFNALWVLGRDKQLTHVNSQAHLNTVGTQLSDQHGLFNYTIDYSLGAEPNIHFTVEDGRKLSHVENFLTLGEETHPFLFTNLTALPAPAEENVPHVITFPVDVVANDETSFQGVASIDEKEGATLFKIPAGTIIPAGYAVITLGSESNLDIVSATTPAMLAADDTENLLKGTTNAIVLKTPYYLLEGDKFVRHESGTVPANSAYIPAENLTADEFLYDESQSTGINAASAARKDATFDIMGRQVNGKTPRHGIYIRNGKKIRL